jgi:hypothetical protein
MAEIVSIATFNQVAQAEAAKSLLESQGINASLDIGYAGRLAAGLSVAAGGVKLSVASRDAQRATEILATHGAV